MTTTVDEIITVYILTIIGNNIKNLKNYHLARATWLILKLSFDLTYIEVWTCNFGYLPVTFLSCRSLKDFLAHLLVSPSLLSMLFLSIYYVKFTNAWAIP